MKPVPDSWTIVILGRWNIAILNPKWLAANIFKEKKLAVEFPIEPGLPLRIIGDKVMLIPREDRLIIGLTEVTNDILKRMESVAIQLLEKLPHTPIIKVGINFGYVIDKAPDQLREHFPHPDSSVFAHQKLKPVSRSYRWSYDDNGQTINMFFELKDEELIIRFNFDSSSPSTERAIESIKGRVIDHKRKTEEILKETYNLTMEES
jgi:hypothetical protein